MSDMQVIDKPTMIVGYSLLRLQGDQHILGFTATLDRDFCQYFTSAKVSDAQVSTQLQDTLVKAIEAFKKKCNGHVPQRIIVYRDGVSDSQKLTIYDIEIP